MDGALGNDGGQGARWEPPGGEGGAYTPPLQQQAPGPWGDHRTWDRARGADLPSRPPLMPNAMQLARTLMCVGAGLAVVGLLVFLATIDQIADSIADDFPGRSQFLIDREVDRLQIRQVWQTIFGVGLWIWMAVKNGQGRKWARVVGTIFGVITVLGAVLGSAILAGTDSYGADLTAVMILSVVDAVLAVVIIVLLFRPDSSDYYDQAARWKAASTLRGY